MDKKTKILDSAQCLMLEKGFIASTVDDICEKAGVTKGSFFYYFKDKEDLGKNVALHFACYQQQMIDEKCCPQDEPDPLKRIYNLLDLVYEASNNPDNKGCLIGIFSQELSETHPNIRKVCEEIFNKFIDKIKQDFALAKEKYAPKASFKPEELAEYFLATIQGSLILMRAKKDNKVIQRSVKQYKEYVKILFGR
jgi:TetR/AcrR family transcriptional regulator, transcriptional repressor for nem operon